MTGEHSNAKLSDETRRWLRFVLEQAVNTDDAHYEQWHLEAIAERMGFDLPDRLEWCERHRLPKADGIEKVCAIGYMPLFDPDEDLPCRIVSRLLVARVEWVEWCETHDSPLIHDGEVCDYALENNYCVTPCRTAVGGRLLVDPPKEEER